MTRLALMFVLAGAIGVAIVIGGHSPAEAYRHTQIDARWDVLEVGPDQRSIELVYTGGGCIGPTVYPTVRETRSSVLIKLREDARVTGPGETCTKELRVNKTTIALKRPLAGRVILGRPQGAVARPFFQLGTFKFTYGRHPRTFAVVPRLIGFARRDATHVLRLRGLRARIWRERRRQTNHGVVAQTPRPERLLRWHGKPYPVVTVRTAR